MSMIRGCDTVGRNGVFNSLDREGSIEPVEGGGSGWGKVHTHVDLLAPAPSSQLLGFSQPLPLLLPALLGSPQPYSLPCPRPLLDLGLATLVSNPPALPLASCVTLGRRWPSRSLCFLICEIGSTDGLRCRVNEKIPRKVLQK